MNDIKKTPIYDIHKKLGGNIVDFYGVYLPILYSSIQEEHEAVRTNIGIFDVSHMGNILIEFKDKKDAIGQLNYLLPNDFSRIYPGKTIYSMMLNNEGGVIDDLLVMCIEDNKYHMVVNSTRIDVDFDWIKSNINVEEQSILNVSSCLGIIALQGPNSYKLMKDISFDLSSVRSFEVKVFTYKNENLIISRTGYTGEDGFELIIKNEQSVELFEELLSVGKKFNLKPCGLGSRDTLRIEAGLPLYGQELDENHSPLQSMMSWSVKLSKQGDFIGKKSIIEGRDSKYSDVMIGFEVLGKSIPRPNMEILNHKGTQIGYVTSGTFSPSLKKNIGIAYINNKYKDSCELLIKIRNKIEKINILSIPFYRRAKGV